MIYSGHIQKVYIHHFDVGQIQGQLILSILICSHDEPNLGRCHIEYNFGIVDSNFLSIQGKYRAYQWGKKKGGEDQEKGDQTRSRILTSLIRRDSGLSNATKWQGRSGRGVIKHEYH